MKIEDLKFEMLEPVTDEQNWDVEKWKHENPMDYLKAIYLLLSSSDWAQDIPREIVMEIAFQDIYKVTRLYIPDVLYKFYSLTNDKKLNKRKLITLQNS